MKRLIALLLSLCLLLCGCGGAAQAPVTEPAPTAQAQPVTALTSDAEGGEEAVDFALSLLKATFDGENNALISPLSIYAALGMTANGADGETLIQMIETLGLSREQLNAWIGSYMANQSEQLKLANSIWLRQDDALTVEQDFLDLNAAVYRADVFQTPMNAEILAKINAWVAEKTNDMIPNMLDQLPENAVMYLINALAFEGKWENPYQAHNVWEREFTLESGAVQQVDLMHSRETLFLEDANATGFLKYYEGGKYAFAALLPAEGISVRDYIDSLTGAKLQQLLSTAQEIRVDAAMPKFSLEYETELSDLLKTMGITDAFDVNTADFTRLGHVENNNIYISQVLHKTAITVAEEGTKAAAATSVNMVMGSAMIQEDRREVILDRPFVYMLIDCEADYPFFLGALMDAESGAVTSLAMMQEESSVSEPPMLTVNFGDQRLVLNAGSFEWKQKHGEMEEILMACGAGPMDYTADQPMVLTGSDSACLFWPMDITVPDSVTATGWTPEGDAVPLELVDGCVVLDSAIAVYEITAGWEAFGTATYFFTAETK